LLLAAALWDFGAILTLETVEITISVNANSRIILASNYTYVDLRKWVAAVGVHFAVWWNNLNGLLVGLRCGEGHGQESESDDLHGEWTMKWRGDWDVKIKE
jgi:hypothetical protein